jgi:quercetin dioxygenase-like cupin family protein
MALALAATPVLAAAIVQVDPSLVPQGFLVKGSGVSTPIDLKVAGGPEHVLAQGSQVYVQHATIQPGGSTGWHTHAGPVIVVMVKGSLTLYEGDDKACTGQMYTAGSGFVDEGFGHIHIAKNLGSTPAEFYATYILPPGSGDAGVKTPMPTFHNPACGF